MYSASIGAACCAVTTRSCCRLRGLNHMRPPRPARPSCRPQLQEQALAGGQQGLYGAVHCGGYLPVTRCADHHRQGGQCYQWRAKHAGTLDIEITPSDEYSHTDKEMFEENATLFANPMFPPSRQPSAGRPLPSQDGDSNPQYRKAPSPPSGWISPSADRTQSKKASGLRWCFSSMALPSPAGGKREREPAVNY